MDMVKGWVDSVQSDPGFAMAHSVCHMAGVIVIIFTWATDPPVAQWLEHLN